MFINCSKGSNAFDLTSYLLRPDKQRNPHDIQIVATNMSTSTPELLAQEFQSFSNLNPRVEKPVVHYSISLCPGETVTREQIAHISEELLKKTGHLAHTSQELLQDGSGNLLEEAASKNCQFFIVQHYDRVHRNGVHHWHIATSAVAPDGHWVDDAYIKIKLERFARELEREFGLQQPSIKEPAQQRNLTTGEYRRKERTQEELPKERLWREIEQASAGNPSMPAFIATLKSREVSIQLRVENNQIVGISYGFDQFSFPGRKLGQAFSFPGLQRHLGIENKDQHLSIQLAQSTPDECRIWLIQQEKHDRSSFLYEKYGSGLESTDPETRDLLIAARALKDLPPSDVEEILFSSPNVTQIKEEGKGWQAAIAYVRQVLERAVKLLQELAQDIKKGIDLDPGA